MSTYTDEALSIAIIVTLAAMSPGPDWAIVTKNALISRKKGVHTAFGVTAAICLHMTYCLFGITALIAQSPYLFKFLKGCGAFYLCYLGYKTIKAPLKEPKIEGKVSEETQKTAFWEGFFTNALNPKAMIFFLSLFSLAIDSHTPFSTLLLYSVIVIVIHWVWFCLLSLLVSHPSIQRPLLTFQAAVSRILGLALIVLGLFLFFYD